MVSHCVEQDCKQTSSCFLVLEEVRLRDSDQMRNHGKRSPSQSEMRLLTGQCSTGGGKEKGFWAQVECAGPGDPGDGRGSERGALGKAGTENQHQGGLQVGNSRPQAHCPLWLWW